MKKELCVTSDIYDDFLFCKTILTENHIEDMMRYASSLGATRFEWILDTLWNIYEKTGPVKYDLLKVACDSAHRNGMRFDVVYKPFESGPWAWRITLPFSFPHSDDDRIVKNETGIVHSVRKFVAENPQYRIARRKGDGEDPGGKLAEIRLVKFDENETHSEKT